MLRLLLHGPRRRKRKRRRGVRTNLSFYVKLARLLALFATLLLLHSFAMMWFEGMSWNDAFWLSATTATTVGYGDLSASSWQGRLATGVLLYAFAIALLAQIAAEFIDHRAAMREKKQKGFWEWYKMNDHFLIVNTPNLQTDSYLGKLVEQIRMTPDFAELPVQILTQKYTDGLPLSLTSRGVVHFSGGAENGKNLISANAQTARFIYIVARDADDPISDSLTFDVLSRLNEIGTSAYIVCEAVQDDNRQRFLNAGARGVIRPIRAYPELVVRAFSSPGTEAVLENLFSHEDDHLHRYDVAFKDRHWGDLIQRMVKEGLGIPMGYICNGEVNCNPSMSSKCTGDALLMLVSEEHADNDACVERCCAAAE